jgi:hypothetical protein
MSADFTPDPNVYLNQIPVTRDSVPAPGNPFTEVYQDVRAIKANITHHPEDTSHMDITFILESKNPYAAFAYANQPDLMEFGTTLCRKEGLTGVAISNRSVPVPCDRDGNPLLDFYSRNESLTTDPCDPNQEGEMYYYAVTYNYLGDD